MSIYESLMLLKLNIFTFLTFLFASCSLDSQERKEIKSENISDSSSNEPKDKTKSFPEQKPSAENGDDEKPGNVKPDEPELGSSVEKNENSEKENAPDKNENTNEEFVECSDMSPMILNLRVHLMREVEMEHSGVLMTTNHITPKMVRDEIINYVNTIYSQADISFRVEKVIEEEAIKSDSYDSDIQIVLNARRDENGRSDPKRLPPLYRMMDQKNTSSNEQLDSNLFHIYLFPFIGNTSQGNAMRDFGFHSVVGVWTNKHNGGGTPEKAKISGSDNGGMGSLSRTIAHEIAHVLSLSHNGCTSEASFNCLMNGSTGIDLNSGEVLTLRSFSLMRDPLCKK